MYKFIINFNYILFSLIFPIVKLNMKKSFSLIFFFFPKYFLEIKHKISFELRQFQILSFL